MNNTNIAMEYFIKNIIKEDLGRGDLFSKIVKAQKAKAYIIAKEDSIFSGEIYAREIAKYFELDICFDKKDGDFVACGDRFIHIEGLNTSILNMERVFLNIISHSSGIATNTNSYVKKLKDTQIKILDTRKTRANLRELEKYSVLNGGGFNHRMGLDDALMLKDTNLKHIDDLEDFVKQARKKIPFTANIECECEDLDMVKKAIKAEVDIIMCDNMEINQIEKAIKLIRNNPKKILIEISGNITKDNLYKYKDLDIDAISSGSLIHQATWIDFSMKML